MATPATVTAASFDSSVHLMNGSTFDLPVTTEAPLFVLGPNGAGKSGLILALYRQNGDRALRIAAHRQTWMESNAVPFSPQDKLGHESNVRGQDNQPDARWKEWAPAIRSGLIIADLIDADNNLSRKVREAVTAGLPSEAAAIAAELPPLEIINELLIGSGIPITLSIAANSAIVASKRGGPPYSIASLSDGERAAVLIAGSVLTAKAGSLILVDEPERHLHVSIVAPLLVQLFSKRNDCAFIVSTHELSLPVSYTNARTVLVRDSVTASNAVSRWDIDVLEPGVEIDDATKEAIIGSRRDMIFIEGETSSLDKPLYEVLFPNVSIFPRSTCSDVHHAVASIRDSSELVWVRAFGIVDQDQLSLSQKADLEAKGVFPLSVYSVEALYYNPSVVNAVAERQCSLFGGDRDGMVATAWSGLLAAVALHADRLAARMTEQVVKDRISLEMPDWKKIRAGENPTINVDAQALYSAELAQLSAWLAAGDVEKIISRYPVRETPALDAVVSALEFRSRTHFEAAVRKLISDDPAMKAVLLGLFGGLPAAML